MLMTVVIEYPYFFLPYWMYCSFGNNSRAGKGMLSRFFSKGRSAEKEISLSDLPGRKSFVR